MLSTAADFLAGSFEGGLELSGASLGVSPPGVWLSARGTTAALSPARSGHAAVVGRGFVYVLGGTTTVATAAVDRAAVGTTGALAGWTSDRPLPSPRDGLAAVVSDGFLVVTGGSDLDEVWVSAIAGDGTLGPWQAGPPLPTGRRRHAMVAHRGWVYVLGGLSGATALGDVQRAELRANGTLSAWLPLPGLPEAMSGHAAVVHAGHLFVLGGTSAGGAPRAGVHRASIAADATLGQWVPQGSMFFARGSVAAVAQRGTLAVLGGVDGSPGHVWLAPLWADATLGEWSVQDTLGTSRDGSAAVGLDGRLYLLGGRAPATTGEVRWWDVSPGPNTLSWANGQALAAGVREHALLAHRSYVYVIGGVGAAAAVLSDVWVASLDGSNLGTFTAVTALPSPRRGAAAVELNGVLYVVGGRDQSNAYLNQVVATTINPDGTLGTWSTQPAFPNPRWRHGVALEQNRLFVVGGDDGASRSDVVSALLSMDGGVGTWSQVGSLPAARSDPAVLAYRDRLYVAGGEASAGSPTNQVLIAPIGASGTLGAWAPGPTVPSPRAGARAVAHGGALYLTGGRLAAGWTDEVLSASVKSDGQLTPWSQARPLTTARDGHGAVVVGDLLWVMGGGASNAQLTDTQAHTLPAAGGFTGFTGSFPLPSARRGTQALATERHVYLVGGSGAALLDEVQMAAIQPDGSLGGWAPTTRLPAGRYLHAAAIYRGRIYVFGGSINSGLTNEVLSAPILGDGSLGAWGNTTPFNVARAEASAAIVDGYAYVLGGQAFTAFADVQVAAIQSDGGVGTWSNTTPIDGARWGHAGLAHAGRVYVFGGQADDTSSPHYLNDSLFAPVLPGGGLGAWTRTSSFAIARRNFPAHAVNGSVFIAGGTDLTGLRHDDVETAVVHADGTLGNWVTVARFSPARRHAALTGYGNRLLMCCGIGPPVQTAYNDVQLAQLPVPAARGAYSVALDLGPTTVSVDSVTLTGALTPGTLLWVSTSVAGATGVFSPPVTVGPVALGSTTPVGLSGRYLRLGLLLDVAAATARDPDAVNRGEVRGITISYTVPDAGPPDAGPTDAGPTDAGSQDGGLQDGGPQDGGPQDGGSQDGGSQDGGLQDGGPQDGGPQDGGPQDGGPQDGGPQDAGSPDAGDAGAEDGGSDAGARDGGREQLGKSLQVGCDCGSAGGVAPALALGLLLLRRRRR